MISISQISIVYWPALLLFVTAVYLASTVIYNVHFHPLRKYPGPFWWKATQIPWAWHSFYGTIIKRACEIHREYGEVIRIAPNELYFSTSQAAHGNPGRPSETIHIGQKILTTTDIYGHRAPNGNGNLKKFIGRSRAEANGTPSIV
jgi:hypothetical protein